MKRRTTFGISTRGDIEKMHISDEVDRLCSGSRKSRFPGPGQYQMVNIDNLSNGANYHRAPVLAFGGKLCQDKRIKFIPEVYTILVSVGLNLVSYIVYLVSCSSTREAAIFYVMHHRVFRTLPPNPLPKKEPHTYI